MQQPSIKTSIRDPGSRVTYHVLAYRTLSRAELINAVRYHRARERRKPKPGTEITIVTIIGHDE